MQGSKSSQESCKRCIFSSTREFLGKHKEIVILTTYYNVLLNGGKAVLSQFYSLSSCDINVVKFERSRKRCSEQVNLLKSSKQGRKFKNSLIMSDKLSKFKPEIETGMTINSALNEYFKRKWKTHIWKMVPMKFKLDVAKQSGV